MSEPRDGRRGAQAASRVGPQAHDVRRALRRLPLRRPGLLDQRRADGRAHRRAGANVLDRPARAIRATTSCSYARVVARHFGTDHHEVLVDEPAMREFVPELVYPPGRAALGLDGGAAALRHASWRARPARSSCRSARAPTSSSTAIRATSTIAASWCPFQRWVPQRHPSADGRRRRARDGTSRTRRAPWRGALRRRPQPRPVLGRRAVLPWPAEGPPARVTPATMRCGRWSGSGTRDEPRDGMPISSSA